MPPCPSFLPRRYGPSCSNCMLADAKRRNEDEYEEIATSIVSSLTWQNQRRERLPRASETRRPGLQFTLAGSKLPGLDAEPLQLLGNFSSKEHFACRMNS